jgi:chorismate dehydratase
MYGLNHFFDFKNHTVTMDIPSICAQKLHHNEVDLGLIPVAAIPFLKESHIISEYCIGADGPVKTVMLYSEVPLEEIKSVFLDYQSRTSVNLVRLLAKKFWMINPQWVDASIGYEKSIKGSAAGVVIGDRAFELNDKYPFVYDLAEEWKKFTNYPFVFACWVSNKKLNQDFIEIFNKSLEFGVSNINLVLDSVEHSIVGRPVLEHYFKKNISYKLTDEKRKALDLFLKMIKTELV